MTNGRRPNSSRPHEKPSKVVQSASRPKSVTPVATSSLFGVEAMDNTVSASRMAPFAPLVSVYLHPDLGAPGLACFEEGGLLGGVQAELRSVEAGYDKTKRSEKVDFDPITDFSDFDVVSVGVESRP